MADKKLEDESGAKVVVLAELTKLNGEMRELQLELNA